MVKGNSKEGIINNGSHVILLIFRALIVALITLETFGIENFTDGISVDELTIIFVALGYLLGVFLFGIGKTAIYIEMILIMAATVLLDDVYMMLFVFPIIIAILSERLNLLDYFAIPVGIGSLSWLGFGLNEVTIIGPIAMNVLLLLKMKETGAKNKEIKIMKIESHVLRKELSESEKEKIQIELDMEGLMNMFIRMKNLNEKIKVDELLGEMIQGARDFFKAEQVALYFLNGEDYELKKVFDTKGKVPKSFDAIEAEDILIENKYMRFPVSRNNEKWCLMLISGKKQALISNDEGENVRYVNASFEEDDYEQIRMFIQQVMKSISYAELLSKMENMANNDYLTGIPNRRRFVEEAEVLIERAKRGADLAMILLDIDFFKKFNDTYGHDKGDEVLKIVANVLKDSIRGGEFIGRLGGEEFAILIPNDNNSVFKAADRLRTIVSEVPFVRQITVSMGIAYYKQGMTFDEMNKKSDEALYKAKESGRNCVIEYEALNE